MGWFAKLFSGRGEAAAQRAERAGEWHKAYELWLGLDQKEEAARAATHCHWPDPWQRVEKLQQAWSWAPQPEVGEALVKAIEAWVNNAAIEDKRDRRLLEQAAQVCLAIAQEERAGDLFSRIAFYNKAAQAYQRAGCLAKMDQAYAREELRTYAEGAKAAMENFQLAFDELRYLDAKAALVQALALNGDDSRIKEIAAGFLPRVPTSPRLRIDFPSASVWVIADEALTIGRGADQSLSIAAPGLSRAHARLRHEGGQIWVADQGSKLGTHIEGAAISGDSERAWSLGQSLELGRHCRWRLHEKCHQGWLIEQLLPAPGWILWGKAGRATPLGIDLHFECTKGLWSLHPQPGLRVDDREVFGLTPLLYGSAIEWAGQKARVGGFDGLG